jgi:serine O-acetyltransferase
MQKAFVAAGPQVKAYDPIWTQLRREADEASAAEPALAGFIYATVLSEPRF